MRQILSNLKTGAIALAELPAPAVEPGHVLIRTVRTLVSQGTERMLVEFGKASLFQKARSQPEKVRQVLSKMRTEGVRATVEAVFRRLDEPLPLGYCNAGEVIGVGAGVTDFAVGDRVVSNGPHAEVVSVPANLVARIPTGVTDDAAAFTVVGAIGLQGLRLARPELGETVVVIGLGLIGQLTAQLARAAGCRVIGFDFDAEKVEVCRRFGVEAVTVSELDPARHVEVATVGVGADAVLITASTASHEVIKQAARMLRQRGRIVLIGVVGLDIDRADFYAKELTFQVSCSYGPGRYDEAYEQKGLDYPIGFVRWTENRNFQAVLQMLGTGALNVEPLITRRVPLANFREVYNDMRGAGLASLFVYEPAPRTATAVTLLDRRFAPSDGALAVIGAGNFAKMTALPALVAAGASIKTIVSAGGVSGTTLALQHGIPVSATDFEVVLRDPSIRGVIVTTRHHLHASQTIAALQAGKHVLVEKPLCLNLDELAEIEAVIAAQAPTLTVGFNRRWAPHIEKMKELLAGAPGPIAIVATMNAGAIPPNHWVHDPAVGGGRLVGEACHFIDLALYLTGSAIEAVSASLLAGATDTASILLRHVNGSTSVVNYLANGHRDVSKERIEVHSQGRTLLLNNFSELRGYGFRGFSKLKTAMDKGHRRQFALFVQRVREGGAALIPWVEVANVTRASLAIAESVRGHCWVKVRPTTTT